MLLRNLLKGNKFAGHAVHAMHVPSERDKDITLRNY